MTIRAIFTVTCRDHEGVEVLILGDCEVIPRELEGTDLRDALGKRQTQYNELIEVPPAVMQEERERRVELAAQMVWPGGE